MMVWYPVYPGNCGRSEVAGAGGAGVLVTMCVVCTCIQLDYVAFSPAVTPTSNPIITL